MRRTDEELFSVDVHFGKEVVLLALRGDVDIVTAPELRAVLECVVDSGHPNVILDMARLDFIDASGLQVIARTSARLAAADGRLIVRTPSDLLRRMLDLVGLEGLLEIGDLPGVDGLVLDLNHLGSEEHATHGPLAVPSGGSSAHPARKRLTTALPADDDVVDGALRLVVALARKTVVGADGVSVSLRRRGQLLTVAATDRTISEMDADQYATGEGPCVDASVEGRWFHVESLGSEQRWPHFTPKAHALGINAILSSPLLDRERPVGSLNIYSRTAGAFEPSSQELASVFASEASAILADAGVAVTDDELAHRMQAALHTRELIFQAQGIVMQREHVTPDGAYTLLRDSTRPAGAMLELSKEIIVTAQGPQADRPPLEALGADESRPSNYFDECRRDAELSHGELWMRYFELGGMSTAMQLEGIVYGALRPSQHDHDVLAHALNERFTELGRSRSVPYSDSDPED